METLLDRKQTADLASLLETISAEGRLNGSYRFLAGYWASQVRPGLDPGDMQIVAWLLEDAADSPWLPDSIQHWAWAWATTISELTGGPGSVLSSKRTA